MDLDQILKELIKHEDVKLKKYILFMLLKFSELVKKVEPNEEEDYLPLIIYNSERLTLIYQSEEIGDFEYIFTDYEEILIILQKMFNDNRSVFFKFDYPNEILSIEEIYQKIDEAVDQQDVESFNYYTDLLNQKG